MVSFRFTKQSNTQLVSSESEDVKEVKKTIDKIVKKKRERRYQIMFSKNWGTIKDTFKKIEEKEES